MTGSPRHEGDAVPGLLAEDLDAPALLFEGRARERLVVDLDFLHAEQVRILPLEPREDAIESRAQRVHVPGRNPHRRRVTGLSRDAVRARAGFGPIGLVERSPLAPPRPLARDRLLPSLLGRRLLSPDPLLVPEARHPVGRSGSPPPSMGWIDGVTFAAAALGGLVLGRAADLGARRLVLALAPVLPAAGSLWLSHADGVGAAFAARIVVGFGVGAGWGVGHAVIAGLYEGSKRLRAAAILQTGGPVGVIAAALAGAVLIPAGADGWRTVLAWSVHHRGDRAARSLGDGPARSGRRTAGSWTAGFSRPGVRPPPPSAPLRRLRHLRPPRSPDDRVLVHVRVAPEPPSRPGRRACDRGLDPDRDRGRRRGSPISSSDGSLRASACDASSRSATSLSAPGSSPSPPRSRRSPRTPLALTATVAAIGLGSGSWAAFGPLFAEHIPASIRGSVSSTSYHLARASAAPRPAARSGARSVRRIPGAVARCSRPRRVDRGRRDPRSSARAPSQVGS